MRRSRHGGGFASALALGCGAALGALTLAGCGSEEDDPGSDDLDNPAPTTLPYEPCDEAVDVGGFRVELASDFTQVQGQVFDGVEPIRVSVELMRDDRCRLLVPPDLSCNPGCAFSTETCGPSGCVPLPQALNLGTVAVDGLEIAMRMEPNGRTLSYSNPARPPLPHPGFQPGADLRLSTGGGDVDVLTLWGWGVTPLTDVGRVMVAEGQPTTLTWSAPVDPGPARILVSLDINVHGSGGASLQCDFPDTGSAEISSDMIDALIDQGLSGFPTMEMTRRTVTSTDIGPGCVDFQVAATTTPAVEVEGIVSCNDDAPCVPLGLTCLPILRNCG